MHTNRISRSLFLHLSALSDSEYTVYVEALRDILDDELANVGAGVKDDELEKMRTSIPVVRAWMKGRFRDLGPGEIDKVLQIFTSQTVQKEISGGQLLAVLRLLMHARQGSDINEGNVFVQAEPSSPVTSRFMPTSNASQSEPPMLDYVTTPEKARLARTNPFLIDTALEIPPSIFPRSLDSPRRASLSSAPPVPPASSKPRIEGASVPPGGTNPFLQRAKTHSGTYQPGPSSVGRTPPLPPRKPAHISASTSTHKPPPLPSKQAHSTTILPSMYKTTSSNSASSSSSLTQDTPPPHRVTPLMEQSLIASRAGASLKRARDQASRIRVLEVIRSSSDVFSHNNEHGNDKERTRGTSHSPGKSARRPVPRPPSPSASRSFSKTRPESRPPSEASLVEVATARLSSRMRARTASPDRMSFNSAGLSDEEREISGKSRPLSSSEQFSPPPTHPARRPSMTSTSSRSRHARTPSYQSYHSQAISGKLKYPYATAVYSPATPKDASPSASVSASASASPSLSPSPLPSPSPVGSPIPPNASHALRPSHSQSMHPSSPIVSGNDVDDRSPPWPLPPPRRKRPESIQVISQTHNDHSTDQDSSSPFANAFGVHNDRQARGREESGVVSSMAARFDSNVHKDSEIGLRGKDKESHTFASIQRTFNAFQQRAQPTLARARYKAEAGILAPRRGFLPNGRDCHLAGEDGNRLVGNDFDDSDAGMDTDLSPVADSEGGDDDTIRGRGGRERGGTHHLLERDNLKLPEGDGWRPL